MSGMSSDRKRIIGVLDEGFVLGALLVLTIDAACAEPFSWSTMAMLLIAQAVLWTWVVIKIRKVPRIAVLPTRLELKDGRVFTNGVDRGEVSPGADLLLDEAGQLSVNGEKR
jgi:hypothetical protein